MTVRFPVRALALCVSFAAHGQTPLPSSREARPRTGSPHENCATSCHRAHRETAPRGGTGGSALETLCLSCHQAQTSGPTFDRVPRLSLLPVEGSSHLRSNPRRRAMEFRREVAGKGGRRIVLQLDCSGCHDSHGRDPGMPRQDAFDSRGQLLGAKPSSYAQICFGCHAGMDAAPAQRTDSDIGMRFSASAASRHRIGSRAAERPDLPSLRATQSRAPLDCVSCHASPDPAGLQGPHVSPYPFLLRAPYFREKELGQGGERANELCYTCHDKSSILANQSFPFHNQHISGFLASPSASLRREGPAGLAGQRSSRDPRVGRSIGFLPGYGEPTPCATCHDPHGSLRNSGLIQFDRNVVGPSSVGAVDHVRTGPRKGTCTLTCHGHDHVQTQY